MSPEVSAGFVSFLPDERKKKKRKEKLKNVKFYKNLKQNTSNVTGRILKNPQES